MESSPGLSEAQQNPAPAPAAAPSSPSSEPAREPVPETGAASPERPGNWLRTALDAVVGRTAPPRSQPDAPADEHVEGAQPDAEQWEPPSWASKQDYDDWLYAQNRRFADRQDRDRERRDQRTREQEREQQIAGLEQEKAQAREAGDTWRVGEIQDQIDAVHAGISQEHAGTEALASFVGGLRAEFDALYLDPVMRDLPQATARKLLAEHSVKDERGALVMAPDGQPLGVVTTEARAALFASALKEIKDAARDAGRAEARTDPVLRKELMAEFMATPEAEEVTPVQVGSARNGSAPADMNSFIRSVRNRRS
jgi:hypothetical protein